MTLAWFNQEREENVWLKRNFFIFSLGYFVLRKSKEEYDEEMSRRLLLEEAVGSTSAARSSYSTKPMAENREAQNTTAAPSQQSNAAKVRHHELNEPKTTCGAARLWNLKLPCEGFCPSRISNRRLTWSTGSVVTLTQTTLSLMCHLFHVKAKTEGIGDSSSSNAHHTPLVNGNTASEFSPVN